MKNRFTILFALLCASVMGFAFNENVKFPDAGTYAQQFYWTSIDGVTAPMGVNSVESKSGFDCIYINVGQADFDPAEGIVGCELAGYEGAGVWVKISSLNAAHNEIYFKNTGGTTLRGLVIHNIAEGADDPSSGSDPAKASECFGAKGHFGNPTAKHVYYQIDYEENNAIISLLSLTGYPLDFAEVQITGVGSYAMTANGAGGYTYTINNPTVDAEWYIRFLYSDTNMPGNEMTAETQSSTDENIIYYQVGACTATTVENDNIALASAGASATASAPETGNVAANAIDGNIGTRWEAPASDPQWICVNFGARKKFNTVQLVHEGAYIKTYDIQISDDGTNFTTIKHVSETLDGFPYEQTIELGFDYAAQYLRIYGTERGTQWGYSLWELRAMYSGASVLTSITLTAADTKAIVGGAGVVLTATPKDQKGQAMEETVSYEITPAAAGHMSGNTYIPDQIGMASIRAYNGAIYSDAVQVLGVTSANLALSTNIDTDNKIIDQSVYTPNGTNAFFAVDGNMGSVWQGSPTNGNVDDSREYDCWFVVDLGAFYNIDLVALHFEGACSELYHIDFSANNSDWNLGYNLVGTEGINARNDYWTELDNNTKVRYVRFWSTKAATGWGMKMFEFEVYGTEWTSGDEEKPVMVSASLVSSTINSAVIAVSATDNDEVARYHVVDDANGINANFTPSDSKITINGLTHNTAYNFTITAKDASNNESENSIVVSVTTPFDGSVNLALNQPCEGGYYDNNPAESADKANDGLENTQWTTYGAHAIELDWWVVDLGQIYNLTNISVLWGDQYSPNYILQARVDAPSAADKADDAAWVTLATVSDAVANAEKSTNVSGVGRYVRFRALARTDFLRLKEFRVYASGVAENDTEAPVMTSASLVSSADTYAVIAVAATDNQGIANYHVVDVGNSFAGNFVAEAGNITVTGLAGGTAYNLVITAIDFFGNVSENSKSVEVTTTAHYTEPQEACAAPTWDASLVKAIYSPTYSANCNLGEWGSGTVVIDDTYGKKYTIGPNGEEGGYFGMVDFTLNCLLMEKLHFDIWVADDMTIRFVPIWGGTEQGITKSLVGQQWNSIDIDLTEYTGITDWSNITQMKLDHLTKNVNIWIANAYFYREAPYVDTEAPTAFTASLASKSYFSVKINAQASDNSGAVNFSVMNGEAEVATGAAASGVATTITVNGLTPGTAYNFNVIAKDEAGNEADPVAVPATTKALPAAAPVPTEDAANVKSLFSNAYSPVVVVENYCQYWWESPTVHTITLGADDNALLYDYNHTAGASFGWAWSAANKIDFAEFKKLHISIYPTNEGTIEVFPVVAGVTTNKVSQQLVANQWNEIVLDYTDKTFAAMDQIGFMNFYDLGEFFIDNVYFYRELGYTRDVTEGKYGTICLPNGGVIEGADIFELAYYGATSQKFFFDEIVGGNMEAGKPYLFFPKENVSQIGVYYTDNANEAAKSVNGLVGYIGANAEDYTPVPDNGNCYIIQNNVYRQVLSGAEAYVLSNRAYIDMTGATNVEPAKAPGARRIGLGVQGEQVVTGIDNLNAGETPVKVMIDGQLYILRGEKMYDATGRLVK